MEAHLYRVSVKALIQDEAGRTLVVRTGNDKGWTLPGGGMDHGEDIIEGLRRELQEELGTQRVEIGKSSILIQNSQAEAGSTYEGLWVLRPVYEARLSREDVSLDDAPDGMDYDYIDIKTLDLQDVQPSERPLFSRLRDLGL